MGSPPRLVWTAHHATTCPVQDEAYRVSHGGRSIRVAVGGPPAHGPRGANRGARRQRSVCPRPRRCDGVPAVGSAGARPVACSVPPARASPAALHLRLRTGRTLPRLRPRSRGNPPACLVHHRVRVSGARVVLLRAEAAASVFTRHVHAGIGIQPGDGACRPRARFPSRPPVGNGGRSRSSSSAPANGRLGPFAGSSRPAISDTGPPRCLPSVRQSTRISKASRSLAAWTRPPLLRRKGSGSRSSRPAGPTRFANARRSIACSRIFVMSS